MLPLKEQLEELTWLLRHRGRRALAKELLELPKARLPWFNQTQWLRADISSLRVSGRESADYKVATESDIGRLRELVSPQTVREMAEYIAAPERFACLLSPSSGRLSNQLCVGYDSITQAGITVNIPSDAIYLFSGFTHPEARRRGLSRSSIVYACRGLDHGRSTAWAWVDTRNGAQRRVLMELGFRLMGTDDLRAPLRGRRRRTTYAPH